MLSKFILYYLFAKAWCNLSTLEFLWQGMGKQFFYEKMISNFDKCLPKDQKPIFDVLIKNKSSIERDNIITEKNVYNLNSIGLM